MQDVDFAYQQITVRDGKGKKDRVTPLAKNLMPILQNYLQKTQTVHNLDLTEGYGSVYLPNALGRKYPNADKSGAGSMFLPAEYPLTLAAISCAAIILSSR